MDFNFPPKEGTGIGKMVPHISGDCADIISKMLAYDPEERCVMLLLCCFYFLPLPLFIVVIGFFFWHFFSLSLSLFLPSLTWHQHEMNVQCILSFLLFLSPSVHVVVTFLNRLSARQALKHPYFREMYKAEGMGQEDEKELPAAKKGFAPFKQQRSKKHRKEKGGAPGRVNGD